MVAYQPLDRLAPAQEARDLRQPLEVDAKTAEDLASGVEGLKTSRAATAKGEEWFEAIREFTETEADKLPPAPPEPPKGPIIARALASAETRWHYFGIGAIAGGAGVGAAIGATVGAIGGGARRNATADRMYAAEYQDCMAGRRI